jgi:hypothetical protein
MLAYFVLVLSVYQSITFALLSDRLLIRLSPDIA